MISILIPIYNGIEFIEESVSSVLNQTYDKWELLIGVNGHAKNSDVFQKAKEYEKKSNKIRVFDFYDIKGKSNTSKCSLYNSSFSVGYFWGQIFTIYYTLFKILYYFKKTSILLFYLDI